MRVYFFFFFLMIVLSISPLTNKKYLNFVHNCKYPVAHVCTCYFFRFFQVQLSYTRYTINNGRYCSVKNCVHKNKSIACTHALIIILNNKHMRVGVLFLGAVLPVNQSFIFLRLNGFQVSLVIILSVVVESLSLYHLYNQIQTNSHKSGMCQ